jgi:uncharacterized protein DUF2877
MIEPETNSINAAAVGGTARRRLFKGGSRGSVHSVYAGAINIMTILGMVSLVPLEKGRGPLNVNFRNAEWPARGMINVGDDVSARNGTVYIGSRLKVCISGAELYDPSGYFEREVLPMPLIASNLDAIRDVVIVQGRFEGVAGLLLALEPHDSGAFALNSTCKYALPEVQRLIDGLHHGAAEVVMLASSNLVGLGTGLTPAVDDMLAGLFASVALGRRNGIGKKGVERLITAIIPAVEEDTSTVSWEFLREAAEGRANERVAGLIEAMYTCENTVVRAMTTDVLSIGATSGTDLAVGVFLGVGAAIGGGMA